MTIRDPQRDLPIGVRGGSDVWDQPQASVLLADDFFEAAPPPPSGGPMEVFQLAPKIEQFGTNVSTPFPSNLTAGNDVWAMVQAPGTDAPDTVTVQGVAGELVHSDFRDVASGTFTYRFYVWRNVSAAAASLVITRAAATTFNIYAIETTPGGTLGQTFYTNANEGAVPLPTSPDGSLAIAALRSDNSTGLTGTPPTVTTGANGDWDYGIYEEMSTGTGNTLQWTKTTGNYRSVKGIIVEPPAGGGGGTNQDIAGSVSVSATSSSDLSLTKPVAASVSGAATATNALSVAKPIAATVSGTAAATGAATVSKPLDGSASGTASVAVALAVSKPLSGSATGALTGTADVTSGADLTGSATGALTASGALAVTKPVSGSSTLSAASTGALAVSKPVSASATGTATASGDVALTKPLSASVSASASATGDVVSNPPVAALSGAVGGHVLNGTILNGDGEAPDLQQIEGSATLTGQSVASLSKTATITGSATATASATGALAVSKTLGGSATTAASATGNVLVGKPIGGSATGALTATSLVRADRLLTGSALGRVAAAQIADLLIDTEPLAGAATAAASAALGLSVGKPIGGAATASVAASGAVLIVKPITGAVTGSVVVAINVAVRPITFDVVAGIEDAPILIGAIEVLEIEYTVVIDDVQASAELVDDISAELE